MLSGKNHYESETEIKELQNVIDYTVKFKYLKISLPPKPYINFEYLYRKLGKCHQAYWNHRYELLHCKKRVILKVSSYLPLIFVSYLTVISYLRQVKGRKNLFCYLYILICECWWMRKSWFECCLGRKVSLMMIVGLYSFLHRSAHIWFSYIYNHL